MFSRISSLLLGTAICLAFTSNAEALYLTTNGDVALDSSAATSPPLNDVKSFSSPTTSSKVYTNQYTGSGFVAGMIRTVVIQRLESAANLDVHTLLREPGDPETLAVYAVTALEGTLAAGVVRYSAGALMVITGARTLDPTDPSSFSMAEILGAYALSPPDAVASGPFGSPGVLVPAPLMNTSTVVFPPATALANLLFGEDLIPTFITNVKDPLSGVPLPIDVEGLYVQALQVEIETIDLVRDAADIAFLNAAAAAAGLSDLGGAGTAFATGIGLAPTDYGPTGPTPGVSSGDFHGRVQATAYIVAQSAVPEPTSMVLFGIGAGLYGFGARRRRRAEKVKAELAA